MNKNSKNNISSDDFLRGARKVLRNLTEAELIEEAVSKKECILSAQGAVCVTTGRHTGRSPKDKFIVYTIGEREKIDWSNNAPINKEFFLRLYEKMKKYAANQPLYVTNVRAGSEPKNSLSIKFINELAWHQLFVKRLFLPPDSQAAPKEDFTVICLPRFKAYPDTDGTKSDTFIILDFDDKFILIGGGKYAGEMKKAIFSVMNYLLPQKNILSMHCSANMGKDKKTALFFGLSGTGKTTLSADPARLLIGDDEHGWGDSGIFNLEGGCYAKCVNLTSESEPEIYAAIRYGTVLENVWIDKTTRQPDYFNIIYTENTRAAYPLSYINNALTQGAPFAHPETIVFLTADAFGVLPPVASLNAEQAMYHFLSGYTSKVAGTERGIIEPEATFSSCFGAPFLPLHPFEYAKLLGSKIQKHKTKVYLVNTGWSGGAYGTGQRISLKYTRAIVTAILNGQLAKAEWDADPLFNFLIPKSCDKVPRAILNPENTWQDKKAYREQAQKLAALFAKNAAKFVGAIAPEILAAGPKA
ncbi:MAG: phosphoenolpyruvate carboxykinase (ATP) [Acidaminococcales bacterium]|jgi:phosphoenolpyruvate carboxykinase (ATP)|nr:phosphoenolpyruvate carboxykinase (ATP) [Acidaminococcales bacterium]